MRKTEFKPGRVEVALAESDMDWRIESVNVIESTNAALVQRATDGAPEGVVLVTRHQTDGRGRQGRTWVDRPGRDLLASMLLRPQMDPEYAGLLSLLPATAAVEVLRDLTVADFQAKWPNDIMIGGEKVGGVLAAANLHDDWAVLGIGINLLGETDELPEGLLYPATTVQAATGVALPREDVLVAIVQQIETLYERGGRLRTHRLLQRYREIQMTTDRQVAVNAPGGEITGIVRGIDDRGRLLVVDADRAHTLDAGDVHITSSE
jgi:BirA family biotin operon repressor/biotin-[acetyl-CoA-carboxylase] ligase